MVKDTQTHTPEMKALNFLIGTWHTTGATRATEGTPAIEFKGTDSYEWILNGSFILHTVDIMMDDIRNEVIEFIGEYDTSNKTYKMRSFDNHGNHTTMDAHFDENGSLKIVGDNMRASLSVDDAHYISAHWESSEDNKTWLPWMDLRLSK